MIFRSDTLDRYVSIFLPARQSWLQLDYKSLHLAVLALVCILRGMWGTEVHAQGMESPSQVAPRPKSSENLAAQAHFTPITPWEFSSYNCKVWLSISPKLRMDDAARENLKKTIRSRLEADFGGVCNWAVQTTPDSLDASVLYRIENLTYEQLLARETTLVIAKSEAAKAKFLAITGGDPSASIPEEERVRREQLSPEQRKELEDAQARAASISSVRTLDSALERIPSISMLPVAMADLKREMTPFLSDERWTHFADRIVPFHGSIDELNQRLESGESLAALVAKADVSKLQESARAVPTRLPWQPEALLRESDKIFLVSVDVSDDLVRIKTRELDSMLNRIGPVSTSASPGTGSIASSLAYHIQQAFSAVVRIEETDPFTATLRVRAGGLITSPNHPAGFRTGDVLLPFVRRVDVNGNATLVQPIPFTFVAATERIDRSTLLYGAIFTASQGSLTAAKNRRIQRLGLKVKTISSSSELSLTYRPTVGSPRNASPTAASGIEIFRRVPGVEGMESIGRTDWRGKLQLQDIAPPVLRYRAPHTSPNPAVALARQSVPDPVPPPTYLGNEALEIEEPASEPPPESPKEPAEETTTETADETATETAGEAPEEAKEVIEEEQKVEGEIALNVPLYLYYIKSGDVLLARMPIVVGSTPLVVASLPDDRRRLETEAYLKGLQSEVLDLVVRRKILEARFERHLADGKVDEAKEVVEELKRIKSYDRISDDLLQIQNRAINPSRGQIGPNLETRLRSMIQSTRQLIDKWLQEDLVRKFETKLSENT